MTGTVVVLFEAARVCVAGDVGDRVRRRIPEPIEVRLVPDLDRQGLRELGNCLMDELSPVAIVGRRGRVFTPLGVFGTALPSWSASPIRRRLQGQHRCLSGAQHRVIRRTRCAPVVAMDATSRRVALNVPPANDESIGRRADAIGTLAGLGDLSRVGYPVLIKAPVRVLGLGAGHPPKSQGEGQRNEPSGRKGRQRSRSGHGPVESPAESTPEQ